MSTPATSTRLAWGLCALALLLVATGPVVFVIAGPRPKALLYALALGAVQISTALVGAVVASRLPRNAVGWILVGMGSGLGISNTFAAYGRLSRKSHGGPFPGEALAVWFGGWTFTPVVFGGVALLVYVFPDGRFLSPRWRLTARVSAAVVLTASVVQALLPGPLQDAPEIVNPLGAPGRAGDVVEFLTTVTDLASLPVFTLAVATLVVRYRRSRGVERQQLKWISSALILVTVSLALTAGVPGIAGTATFFVALFALAAMPLATGVAMLRYRLYDIDVVINRALVYGALTATLAGFYVGAVLLLQLLLRPFTAGSSLAIAVSTLAVAGLFGPVRRRIQRSVDRRFFRSRYDAARTIELFGARLRDEVDLVSLSADLADVVDQTMRPAHVSLWIRPSTATTGAAS